MMRALMLVLVVCCLVVLTVASCGKKAVAPESSGAPLASGEAAAPAGEEAQPADSEGPKPASGGDGDFHGIEIYPGAAANETASMSMGGSETKAFETTDAFEEVAAFYKDRYGEKASGTDGGIITGSQKDGRAQTITWQEDGAMLSIIVGKGEADEKVTIVLSNNKLTN